MLGTTLGSYRIDRELGRGGMGAVYVGTHTALGRRSAIKVLLPEMSRDEGIVQRFFNEAKAASSIDHPGIIEIFDYGRSDDGSAYIVMELLDGESLADRLKKQPKLHPDAAISIARQVAGALAAAHAVSIVHRDLKPDNVFLVRDPELPGGERIKLLDFGIAKLAADRDAALTQTGALMGTPYYMSPEQCRGAKLVDARSDLYSLGCMLFQMLAGVVPFTGEGIGEIIAAHIHVEPPAIQRSAPLISDELAELIAKLLAKSPAERPQTADDLIATLSAVRAVRTLDLELDNEPLPIDFPDKATVRSIAPVASIEMKAPPAVVAPTVEPPRRSSRALVYGLIAVAVVAFYVLMWFAMG